MEKMEKPATQGNAFRVPSIKAVGAAFDTEHGTETHIEMQSKLLAIRYLMRRGAISFWHAKAISDAQGMGGR